MADLCHLGFYGSRNGFLKSPCTTAYKYRGTDSPGSLASAILASYSPYDVTYDVIEIPITQPPTLRGTAKVVSRVTAKPRVTLGLRALTHLYGVIMTT